ncbi:MAG: 5-formyltetrahydrofolate cyclo-ligase, partial [Coriobacteriia bacterium]|nr:5-formyltetrahydrofolate cyclo-ligase [Coriobacteriia bacterium]
METDRDIGPQDAKAALRREMRELRRSMSPEDRTTASAAMCERVLALPELAGPTAVLVYGAMPEEPDPAPLERELRARGVRIAYPRVAGPRSLTLHWIDDPLELLTGAFGLREPAPDHPKARPEAFQLVIVPGLAFDAEGHRLGFGAGYYDALLASLPAETLTVALAYDGQIVERVPRAAHDHPVRVIVTP